MKTLYISDLDGTLLNAQAEISKYTTDALNQLIEDGMYFSVATARTSETAIQMLKKIKINVPIILMNGVAVFDIKKNSYVITHIIQKDSVLQLLHILRENHLTGFLYTIEGSVLSTHYECLCSEHAKQFVREREEKYGKKFTKVESFFELVESPVVYFSVSDKKENLISVYEALREDNNLHIEFYRDIYEEDFWYLEVCSAKASKYNAVQILREKYQFDQVICFGDNLNDLSMFLASDESYAVENAKEEVKSKATGVIESNNNDGVAKWLLEKYGE